MTNFLCKLFGHKPWPATDEAVPSMKVRRLHVSDIENDSYNAVVSCLCHRCGEQYTVGLSYLLDDHKQVRDENDRLRSLLARGSDPCIYYQLPRSDMPKCASGFPGCGRADDLMNDAEYVDEMCAAQPGDVLDLDPEWETK